jgi:sugar lactone lactonase YvrE
MEKLATAVLLSLAAGICLAGDRVDGPMGFEPLQASVVIGSLPAAAPLALPTGFRQRIVVDESGLDIYPGIADWTDMNTVNENGPQAGRYLYRTHEVRPSHFASPQAYRDAGGGAVSVVDLRTGNARVLVQRSDWEALDGLVWTPWHSLLFAEEASSGKSATLPDPDAPEATEGLLYEARLADGDPATATGVTVRPLLGSMAHEGIEIDRHGHVYVIDEHRRGSLYRFVPDTRGDLGSGRLYALKVDESGSGNGTGPARWVALDMQQVPVSARIAAARAGATRYNRPEDLEIIGEQLSVAITGEARVLAVSLGATPVVSEFVTAGSNVPHELPGRTGFRKPDNLARDAAGNLWIVEDNEPSDIWVATPDADGDGRADRVALFGSLSTPGAEASGMYFGTEPATLFVNVQHTDDANDMTLAVSRQ